MRTLLASRSRALVAAVLVCLLASLVWVTVLRPATSQEFTLLFPSATNLHSGDAVTVLDVKVGRVVSVEAERTQVRVRVRVDGDRPVPAQARATIISPTMVSVRHVELSPAYTDGQKLQDGATIPQSRTAVPVEWHQVQTELTRLTEALGPRAGNRHGALNTFLGATAANLDGRGDQLGDTLRSMAAALQTVSENRGDLFATVRNLEVFIQALSASDATVRSFSANLAAVSGQLDDDSATLVGALHDLGVALDDVNGFVRANDETAVRSVRTLQTLTHNLADHRQRIADILQSAPTALSNYYNIYYPKAHAMTGTFVGQFLDSPAVFVCSALYSLGGTPEECQRLLAPVAKYLNFPVSPIGSNPIENNGSGGTQEPGEGGEPSGRGQRSSGGSDLDLLGGMMLGLNP